MNSDGLTGYRFSHDGYWYGHYTLAAQTDTASKCAAECDKDDKCIAFSYRYGYNKWCAGYHSLGTQISSTEYRAYVLGWDWEIYFLPEIATEMMAIKKGGDGNDNE